MADETPIPPLYYEKPDGTNIIVHVLPLPLPPTPHGELVLPEGRTRASVQKSVLYEEKAQVANASLELNGIAPIAPAAMADMLQILCEPNQVPGIGSAFEAILEPGQDPHIMYKKAVELLKQHGDSILNDEQKAVLNTLAKMDDKQWERFYGNAIEPVNLDGVQERYNSVKAELEQKKSAAASVEGQPLKFGLRTIYRSGDFDKINTTDDGTKYQMGLAAANSAMEPGYYGHSSYTSPTRTATIYVVDDLAQARATFNRINTNPNSELPYKTEESARNDVLRLSAYDGNTHVQHDAIIVSRDYLQKNLGKELAFMKGFEEHSKGVTHISNSGRVNMHDFLEQMSKDSELQINSVSDYEQKAPLQGVLAERTGKSR